MKGLHLVAYIVIQIVLEPESNRENEIREEFYAEAI
jgi:phage shock protein PspC (stress-responsive transcriptional regulator)